MLSKLLIISFLSLRDLAIASPVEKTSSGLEDVETQSKLKTTHQGDIITPPRLLNEIVLSQNNLIDTIVDPPKYFSLTYKIYPNQVPSNWASILRYTGSNNNCCNWPDRWMFMKFHPGSYKMHFVAGSTVNGNAFIDKTGIQGNTWNEVKVEAIGDKISLFINNELKGSVPNTNRPSIPEVKVYAGDRFHTAANAKISDLTFTPLDSDTACLPRTGIDVHVSGCSYDKLVASIQQTLYYGDPVTHQVTPCIHSGADELNFHLPSNTTDVKGYVKGLCKQAQQDYENEHQVPWSDVTLKGDKFDKEYYDGNGDWNEEHQSNYPHPPVIPGQASNVLNRDAERVDDLFETHLQRYPLQWPGDAPTSMTNFDSCKYQTAMCCWVSDRQANDNNGNCATPYDERCLDADPGDNTDLCAVDMARSTKDSTHVDDGFAIFPDGEEGPVHCHGLAWGQDEMEPDFRYRANNLFFVSMSDHMHDRGYVRNVQGAPMCGCVESMPIVSRSDCTEISAKEFYKFTFPGNDSGEITASLDYVDINFNACRARKNNNLERFVERLRDEGRISKTKYYKVRNTIVGDNQCPSAIDDLIFAKGYKNQAPEYAGWTMLYGRGAMISADSNPELWKSIDQGSYIRRVCKSCSQNSHKDIVYKRLTPSGCIDFRDLFLKNWYSDPDGEGTNIRGTDFKLYSTFEHAQNDQSPWNFCNYNDSGIGFPRDCGPNGAVGSEWNSMSRGGETDFAYYLYTADGINDPDLSCAHKSTNLALQGAIATQSSTDHGGVASRVIDGGLSGNWGDGQVQHTRREDNPWVKVTLAKAATIKKVTVWNRTDCCKDRLNNSDIQILDSAGNIIAQKYLENTNGMRTLEFNFDDVVGSAVRVKKRSNGNFNIAEIEVFGYFNE